MAEIQFIDQTFRDGQQSLWGMKMRAQHMLPVAGDLDGAGFSCIELTGTTIHTVLVREFREDPYESLSAVTQAMPRTRLRGGMRPDTAGFTLQPNSVIDLPVSQPTSCAFGGPGLKTLYVTTARQKLSPEALAGQPLAGSLLALDVGVAGLPEPAFAG